MASASPEDELLDGLPRCALSHPRMIRPGGRYRPGNEGIGSSIFGSPAVTRAWPLLYLQAGQDCQDPPLASKKTAQDSIDSFKQACRCARCRSAHHAEPPRKRRCRCQIGFPPPLIRSPTPSTVSNAPFSPPQCSEVRQMNFRGPICGARTLKDPRIARPVLPLLCALDRMPFSEYAPSRGTSRHG